jgi:hypothetical protein
MGNQANLLACRRTKSGSCRLGKCEYAPSQGETLYERMPVLLVGDEAQDQWMAGSDADAFALCKPYPPERMRLVQTGYEKRDLHAG